MTSPETHPVVLVTDAFGKRSRAELREAHPTRPGIVKVVYLDSRTAAWIKRSRIVGEVAP